MVDENENGEDSGATRSILTVDEITTRHLKKLRISATDYLGKDVSAAVITVPSDFTDEQKAALTANATAAGIEVLQYIDEPVSALLAHDAKLQQSGEATPSQQDKNVVVADIGGTRSDVAIVASRNGLYTTLATAHDYSLGGASLDKVLVEYAAKEFLKKHKDARDPRSTERSLSKLTLEAEAVKKALSIGATANFSIESLVDGIDFQLSVNRTRFELLAGKVFSAIVRLIESAVAKAGLDILDVDEILLSGGSSHTPKLASLLQSHFPEETTITAPSTFPAAVNPSELASRGAAIQASLIAEFDRADIEKSTEAVVIVTPHLSKAIGILDANKQFHVVVPADTPVPVRRTAQITIANGGDVLVTLAEGVREIKITKEEPAAADKDADDSEEDDDEPEEIRTKEWKAGNSLAEIGIKGVQKGGKVEVQINVGADLEVTVVAREVGGKGGVRGTLGEAVNGTAA